MKPIARNLGKRNQDVTNQGFYDILYTVFNMIKEACLVLAWCYLFADYLPVALGHRN